MGNWISALTICALACIGSACNGRIDCEGSYFVSDGFTPEEIDALNQAEPSASALGSAIRRPSDELGHGLGLGDIEDPKAAPLRRARSRRSKTWTWERATLWPLNAVHLAAAVMYIDPRGPDFNASDRATRSSPRFRARRVRTRFPVSK